MNPFVAYVLAVFVLFVGVLTRPRDAACPSGWWVNGVRPSGVYGCRPNARERPSELVPPYRPVTRLEADEDVEINGRLYCTPGSEPRVVNDGRHVTCWRTR